MAGGSDAHGDFNFRREGYLVGVNRITETAIGTPRNLVYLGAANGEIIRNDAGTGFPVGQRQVVSGLRSGKFIVTDGPVVRIAYDTNGNGRIDAQDASVGDVGQTPDSCGFELLVEWKSTPEFGRVKTIDLTLGVFSDEHARGWIYQAWRRPPGAQPGDLGYDAGDFGGNRTWVEPGSSRSFTSIGLPGARGQALIPLFFDPTGDLRLAIDVPAYEGYGGQRRVFIDPNTLPVASLRTERRCPSAALNTKGPGIYKTVDPAALKSRAEPAVASAPVDQPTHRLDRAAIIAALGSDAGFPAPIVQGEVSARMRRPVGPDLAPDGRVFDPGDQCPVVNLFEEAATPDRLYIRATAVNELAPGSDRHCSPHITPPTGDKRPFCVRRQAYTNPVWLEIGHDPKLTCRKAVGEAAIQ